MQKKLVRGNKSTRQEKNICHIIHTIELGSADVTLNRPLRWTIAPSDVSSTAYGSSIEKII
jgi:hypothetical protein